MHMKKMIMKAIAFCAASLMMMGLLSSCNSVKIPTLQPVSEQEAPEKYVPYETIYVNVPADSYCVVFVGSTKVAVCYHSGPVLVPKSLFPATKASDDAYTIVTVAGAPTPGVASENTLEMVLAFEDTKDGDHDYNDLIFQVRLQIVNNEDGTNNTTAEITPVAYGATKKIAMGVVLSGPNNTYVDKLLYDDCRAEMFEGDQGFINTRGTRKKYSPISNIELASNLNGAVTCVSWYIEVNGERLYASNTFQQCLDNENMPQGLVLINLRDDIYSFEKGGTTYYCGNDFWQFPEESVNVNAVYPGFDEAFLTKGNFSVLDVPQEGSKYVNAIMPDENLVVNDNDCLYTLYSTGGDTPEVEAIQLWEGGPKWATFNLGATKPEEYGDYFSWGNLARFTKTGEKYHENPENPNDFREYYWNVSAGGKLIGDFESGDIRYDAARFNWGGKWRMPTIEEIQYLTDANVSRPQNRLFTYTVIDDYNGTGIRGGLFTLNADHTKTLFFPFAGNTNKNQLGGVGTVGKYWSTGFDETLDAQGSRARVMTLDGSKANPATWSRNDGLAIRPVCD